MPGVRGAQLTKARLPTSTGSLEGVVAEEMEGVVNFLHP